MLDDILLEDGRVAPFDRAHATYSAMGRFGNQLLVGGETEPALSARQGEVVRFYLTNTANTRVFNVSARGARMKLVGGDSGRCEHERFVQSVVLAPSERVVVDVLFDAPGEAALEHRTPDRTHHLGSITVDDERADPAATAAFETLRTNPEMVAERERIAPYLDAEPDKILALVAEMDFEAPEGATVYVCPMHPEVVSDEPGKCPKCAMKLMPRAVVPGGAPSADDATSAPHAHVEGAAHEHAEGRSTSTRPVRSSGRTTWSRSTAAPPANGA